MKEGLEICITEALRCRPYFLCLMGERYGACEATQPGATWLNDYFEVAQKTYPWVQNLRDRSITEIEIRAATLNNQWGRTDLKRNWFFFKDPELSRGKPGWTEGNARAKQQLADLKKEIKSIYNVTEYNDINKMVEDACERIKAILGKDFREQEKVHSMDAQEAYIKNRLKSYVGCPKLSLNDQEKNAVLELKNTEEKLFCITGASGTGKSALLCSFADTIQKEIREGTSKDRLLYHFIGATNDSSDIDSMLQRLLKVATGTTKVEEKGQKLRIRFQDVLKSRQGDGRTILILDGLDQLDEKAQDLSWLPAMLPSHLKIITSALEGKALGVLRCRNAAVATLLPFDAKTKKEAVDEYLKLYGKKMTPGQVDLLCALEKTNNPLFLRVLLNHLISYGTYQEAMKSDDIFREYIKANLSAKDLEGLFALVLESWVGVYGDMIVPWTLKLLQVSRRGLSEKEVRQLVSGNEEKGADRKAEGEKGFLWYAFRHAAAEFLVSQTGRLSFFHKALRNAVALKFLRIPVRIPLLSGINMETTALFVLFYKSNVLSADWWWYFSGICGAILEAIFGRYISFEPLHSRIGLPLSLVLYPILAVLTNHKVLWIMWKYQLFSFAMITVISNEKLMKMVHSVISLFFSMSRRLATSCITFCRKIQSALCFCVGAVARLLQFFQK
mmetsp:Transcript_14593/g.24120  ORF Transcript_14593/g.24120 Transcript_14593/m.24120 type:complete len:672 (+) Transcript_14593:449-2464(+)